MMEYENIQIQLLDTPPLVSGSTLALLPPNLVRADALLIVIDLSEDPLSQMETITSELTGMRIGIGRAADENDEEEIIRHGKKALIVGNKIDIEGANENYEALGELYRDEFPVLAISAARGTALEELKLAIFQLLEIIRVYTKTPGQKPDMDDPIVLPIGSTLADAATEVHKDFAANLKFARIWGSGKHDGVMAKRDHILQDGDIIELHM
jgi:ribosome-interacting GTPase 1